MARFIKGRKTLVGLLFGGLLVLTACKDPAAAPSSPEQVLLDAAIHAIWGDKDPASLRSMETVSRVMDSSAPSTEPFARIQSWMGPKKFLERRNWLQLGLTEKTGFDGKDVWATIDGKRIPISKAKEAEIRLQPLLFEMSRIAPLKSTERFALEARGRVAVGTDEVMERLEVRPKNVDGVEMIFDFDPENHLLRQVTLQLENDETMTLILDDYQPVDGIRFPRRIEGRRRGRFHSLQIRDEIRINTEPPAEAFAPPVDRRDDEIRRKSSLGGRVAYAIHEGSIDDVEDTIEELQNWLKECEAPVVGPLALLEPLDPTRPPHPDGESSPLTACIAVGPLPHTEPSTRPPKSMGFKTLTPHPCFERTFSGDEDRTTVIASLKRAITKAGLKSTGPVIEVFFTPDRMIRQIQVPVEQP
ncbi:MAG TPA: hypothetical protein ENK43_12920 [Planctomycetes bacterium]|nr:hypothetical protein [Planctomycetota bacterium]